jgi:hypothetical protein
MRGQRHAPAAFYLRETPGTYFTGGSGWAPGPVWTGAENLAPTGIRSPDLQARSQSLYRLSYPTHRQTAKRPETNDESSRKPPFDWLLREASPA